MGKPVLIILGLMAVFFTACQTPQRELPQPNVLFISIDDLNDWTGFMGGHPQAQTPNIDRLAGEGMAFMRAYCAAPVCGPSRTALLFGQYPHRTGSYGHHEIYNPKNIAAFDNLKSVPALFREQGYYTAGCGKTFHYRDNERDFEDYHQLAERMDKPDPGNPETYIHAGPKPLSDFYFGPVPAGTENQMPDAQSLEWISGQLKKKHEKPFFLAVGFEKPHLPWIAPQENFNKFDLHKIELPIIRPNDLNDLPEEGKIFARNVYGFLKGSDHEAISKEPELWKRLVRAYLASANRVDEMVGKVMDALNSSSYKDNTIVVLFGDHGFHLGEKEHWRKMALWQQATRVPFIIRTPQMKHAGTKCRVPVSLLDIYPTLIELCGLKSNQHQDGSSLVTLLHDPDQKEGHPVLISHGPGNFAVVLDKWHYIKYRKGGEELYNLESDPNEFDNLADHPGYRSVIKDLEKHVPRDYVAILDPRFRQFYAADE